MLKFLFPNYCIYCGIEAKESICKKCWEQFQTFKIIDSEHRCNRCFHKLNPDNPECYFCKSRFLFFDKVYSLYEYNSFTKKALIEWKYQNQRSLYKFFVEDIAKIINIEKPDRVGYINSGKLSKNYRNYNILKDLCFNISKMIQIPFYSDILKIKKNKQSKNKQFDRFFEVLFSFELTNKIQEINKYLLIEDTITTGATINEVSRILKKERVKKVIIVSIFLEEIQEGSLWKPLVEINKMIS